MEGTEIEYNAFPNGLSCAPRTFTKLLKPVFATLRGKGHVSTAFLDDSLLLGESEQECIDNVQDTLDWLRRLGFIIHPSKLVLKPTERIQYLGVIINSESEQSRWKLSRFIAEVTAFCETGSTSHPENCLQFSSCEIPAASLSELRRG